MKSGTLGVVKCHFRHAKKAIYESKNATFITHWLSTRFQDSIFNFKNTHFLKQFTSLLRILVNNFTVLTQIGQTFKLIILDWKTIRSTMEPLTPRQIINNYLNTNARHKKQKRAISSLFKKVWNGSSSNHSSSLSVSENQSFRIRIYHDRAFTTDFIG